MSRPSLFIGSSSQGDEIARAVEVVLNDHAEVMLWKNGVFGLGQGTLEALIAAADKFDFAVLVLTPDDVTTSQGATANSPRDNVLFELGLFMGRLGRERTFIIRPRGEMRMPSDLAGVTVAMFDPPQDVTRLKAALSPACYDIINAIKKLGGLGERVPLPVGALATSLNNVIQNVSAASRVRHPVLDGEIASRSREWALESRPWANGRIIVRKNYQAFLAQVYRSASTRIFSTSIPQYRDAWFSLWGDRLLEAQKNNIQAESTRVFVFGAEGDITATDEEIFAQHDRAGVRVLVYVDAEDKTFLFPPEIGADWTLVDDGKVIGVTRQIGDFFEAEWSFNDEEQAERFRTIEERLRLGSLPLEKWKSRRGGGR